MPKQAEFSAKRKGDINEINVCSLLLKDGYFFQKIANMGLPYKDRDTNIIKRGILYIKYNIKFPEYLQKFMKIFIYAPTYAPYIPLRG